MILEFPYQLVAFLHKPPKKGEPVYYGENGWYPQLALKRRFKLEDIDEARFIHDLKLFFNQKALPSVITGELVKPERMPVRVIDIKNKNDIKSLHLSILDKFDMRINSRYPDREGDNYYPHITAEYDNQFVIPVDMLTNREITLDNIWLLKDVLDENSIAYAKII